MWAFGFLVHQLLREQIPFREIKYEADGPTELDIGTGGIMEPGTDIFALKI